MNISLFKKKKKNWLWPISKCKAELIRRRHIKCSHRGLKITNGLGESEGMSFSGFPSLLSPIQ